MATLHSGVLLVTLAVLLVFTHHCQVVKGHAADPVLLEEASHLYRSPLSDQEMLGRPLRPPRAFGKHEAGLTVSSKELELVKKSKESGRQISSRVLNKVVHGKSFLSRPGFGKQPNEVVVAVKIHGFTRVQADQGRTEIWLSTVEVWKDPRLAYDPVAVGVPADTVKYDYLDVTDQKIWVPNLTSLNRVSSEGEIARTVHLVGAHGLVVRTTTRIEKMISEMYFHWYPFHHDTIRVRVGLYEDIIHECYLTPWDDEMSAEVAGEASAGDRRVKDYEYTVYEWEYKRVTDTWDMDSIDVRLFVKHRPEMAAVHVVLPCFFITVIAYTTLFMSGPTYANIHPGPRTGSSVFVFLASFSYLKEVVSYTIPMVPYFTFMDVFVLATMLLTSYPIALIVWEIYYVSRPFRRRGKAGVQEEAERLVLDMDRWSQVLFPFLVVMLYGIFMVVGVYSWYFNGFKHDVDIE